MNLLIVDDNAGFARTLARRLEHRGHRALTAASGDEALDRAVGAQRSGQPVDGVVLDLRLEGDGGAVDLGLNWIGRLRAAAPDARLVLLTGYASLATAVDAIKRGADDYLAKPVDLDSLLLSLAPDDAETDAPMSGQLRPDGVAFERDARAPQAGGEPTRLSLSAIEWEHIQRVLAEHDHNISATARALGMHRRTLQRKLAKHGPSR